MAEDKKDKINLRIHLTGNKYILANGKCMWIVSETIRHKDGKEIPVQKTLSGYHTDFVNLYNSYLRKTTLNAEIEGELADLAELVKKTRAEIKRWFTRLDKAVDWSDGK